MKRIITIICLTCLLLSTKAFTSNSVNVNISISVGEINEIAINENQTLSLKVDSATPGEEPSPAIDTTSHTYSLTTNDTKKKITGQLDVKMPDMTTLSANLTAPSGGKSLGYTVLSDKPVDLVNGVSTIAEKNIPIAYKFTATIKAGVIPVASKTIIYTLTDSK